MKERKQKVLRYAELFRKDQRLGLNGQKLEEKEFEEMKKLYSELGSGGATSILVEADEFLKPY